RLEAARRAAAARAARLGRGLLVAFGAGRGLQERRRLAHRAVLAAQHALALAGLVGRRRGLGRGQRGRLRLDDVQRIALGALPAVTLAAELARRAVATVVALVAALPLALGALARRAILALAVIPVVPLALVPLALVPLIPLAIVPLPVVALAVLALAAVVALALVALPRPLALALLTAIGLRLRRLLGRLAALVLEVDVVAGRELVATDDLADRTLRLHGAQDPEVVLGVLQVVLRQHAVAGRRGVARQLLVLFVDVLGCAAHLHAVRPVRIERAVGVVLGLAAAATTTATAVALTLHPLEISHAWSGSVADRWRGGRPRPRLPCGSI